MSQEAPGRLELVRTFVNTVDLEDLEKDELRTPEGLRAWLSERSLLAADAEIGDAELKRALAVREALRELLLANHSGHELDPEAIGVVDGAAKRAKLGLRFAPTGTAKVEPAAAGVDGALGELLTIVADSQADGTWARLKACPWDTCKWAFYDHSRNRSGVWCNMAVCGNRAKAQAFRDRQRGATA